MNKLEDLRELCLSMKGATEDMPFDETTLCFRVGGKIFAITDIEDRPVKINLKCDPEKAVVLREQYEYIKPGWHMNKIHWNTVNIESNISEELISELIINSYELIYNKLSKKIKTDILKK
jgi:predicted DNA-binding protein (MmcQ/YjbR family)